MTDSVGNRQAIVALERLLQLYDEAFVIKAYEVVLHRAPDTDGLANYLTRLRAGTHKGEIVLQLAESVEGRQTCQNLAVIQQRFGQYRPGARGFWHFVVRLFTGGYDQTTERQLRAIENRLYLLEQTIARHGEQLSELISAVQRISQRPANQNAVNVAATDYDLSPKLGRIVTELKAAIELKRT